MKPIYLILLAAFAAFSGCTGDFFDVRSDKTLVVPSTLQDLQALMDNTRKMNSNLPALGEVGADNYYQIFTRWQALAPTERNAYVWAQDIYEGEGAVDWNIPYEKIFYANVALNGLQELASANSSPEWKYCKGQALFFRAHALYQLAQLFAQPYSKDAATSLHGIPLKLSDDLGEPITRGTLQETYDRILEDLNAASELLPNDILPNTILTKNRPTRAATFALLARVHLVMGDYEKALQSADESLKLYIILLDYNTLDSASSYPFSEYNSEVIFHATLANSSAFGSPSNYFIDSTLYRFYETTDLRKSLFFSTDTGGAHFKGSYDGSSILFGGISTGEVLLTRAECYARQGDAALALEDLNKLLRTRHRGNAFVPFYSNNVEEVMEKILLERRKELIFRGIRWTDLRRLNQDSRFAVTLKRRLGTNVYELLPGSKLYTYPIPNDEIAQSQIPQNER